MSQFITHIGDAEEDDSGNARKKTKVDEMFNTNLPHVTANVGTYDLIIEWGKKNQLPKVYKFVSKN